MTDISTSQQYPYPPIFDPNWPTERLVKAAAEPIPAVKVLDQFGDFFQPEKGDDAQTADSDLSAPIPEIQTGSTLVLPAAELPRPSRMQRVRASVGEFVARTFDRLDYLPTRAKAALGVTALSTAAIVPGAVNFVLHEAGLPTVHYPAYVPGPQYPGPETGKAPEPSTTPRPKARPTYISQMPFGPGIAPKSTVDASPSASASAHASAPLTPEASISASPRASATEGQSESASPSASPSRAESSPTSSPSISASPSSPESSSPSASAPPSSPAPSSPALSEAPSLTSSPTLVTAESSPTTADQSSAQHQSSAAALSSAPLASACSLAPSPSLTQ